MTIPNIPTCAALPRIGIAGGCSHNVSSLTEKLTSKEIIDLIDAQPSDRSCVPAGQVVDDKGNITDPGLPACAEDQTHGIPQTVKARGASIIIPPDSWGPFSTAVQEACRELGSRCNYQQVQDMMARVNAQTRVPDGLEDLHPKDDSNGGADSAGVPARPEPSPTGLGEAQGP